MPLPMPATMPALAILQMMTIESESGNRGAILNLFQISFVDAGFPAANLGSFFSAAEKTSVQSEKKQARESLESLPDDLQSSPTNSLLCALHIYVCLQR